MSAIFVVVLFFFILISLVVGSTVAKNRTIRIGFGIGMFIWAGFMFLMANVVQTLNFNAAYSSAASQLLKETVVALEKGHSKEVLAEYTKMNNKLNVTYENKGNFKELAEEAANELKRTTAPSKSN